jgi:hypothetical protein
MSRRQSAQQRQQRQLLVERERERVQEYIARQTALTRQLWTEMQRAEMQRLRDRQLMAEFIEVSAPEPELVPYPGAQLDLVPTPMPFEPEAPPNG